MVIICWLNVERKSYRDRIIILLLKGRILKKLSSKINGTQFLPLKSTFHFECILFVE